MVNIPGSNAPDKDFELHLKNCGKPFGIGTTRDAYSIPCCNNKIIKVSKVPSNMTNWAELVIFHGLIEKSLFGEIFSWSESGKYLVMERLDDINVKELSGFSVPFWWDDKKPSNLGRSSTGEIKIRDYGLLKFDPDRSFKFP